MKLPLSVLMYQLSDDYGYETVNVDVSSEYEGIKLFDDSETGDAGRRFLYLIDEDELEKKHNELSLSRMMSSMVFICICKSEKSAVCTSCRDISVVFLYADVKFAYMFNRMQNIMKMFDEWEKSFHLSILRENSIQDLVDITESLLTHPLFILDRNYTLMGHTRDMSEVGPLMKGIIDNGYASPEEMRRLVDMGVVSGMESFASPRISSYRLSQRAVEERGLDRDTFYSITYRFVSGGRTAGYAVAFHCLSHPTNGYLYLMNMVAERMQLFFEKEKNINTSQEGSCQAFLAGILANPQMSERQMNAQAGHIQGLRIEGRFLLAQLQISMTDEVSYSFISWNLRNSMPQFMPFVFRDSLFILKDCDRSAVNDPEAAGVFFSVNEWQEFTRSVESIDYSLGISDLFFSLKSLGNASVQCREALSIGRSSMWKNVFSGMGLSERSGDNGEISANSGECICYGQVSFIYLVSQLRKVMSEEALESPYFRLLSDHDRRSGTDFCKVMARYITCGSSVTRTAAATYMHRNTILNKVRQAAEIMGDPLDDFTSKLMFMVSYIMSFE